MRKVPGHLCQDFQCRAGLCWVLVLTWTLRALAQANEPPDAIYTGAAVVTLDAQSRVAQAIAVKAGRIAAVGTNAEIRKLAADTTTIHDLSGKVVVPGFYAAHDHFPASGRIGLFTVDLNSPPLGKVANIDDLVSALRQMAQHTPKGQWVTGRGYDDTLLQEKRHPTRDDLDQASADHPIWITHISGHLGVANTQALDRAKITRGTPQPAGGRIRADPHTGEPNGIFEESLSLVTRFIPPLSQEKQLRATETAAQQYAQQGVTTAVIASGSTASINHLQLALRLGLLKVRAVVMTSGGPAADARQSIEKLGSLQLKAGAIKLSQDGSIQGYTGFLSQPYFTAFEADPSYRGYSLRSRAALTDRVIQLHRAGYQIAIHGNGDQAIDDILFAFAEAQKAAPRTDARHRIEHCQTVRDDQLDTMKALGITPSFFVGHVYYWGDRHRDLFLGPQRAARISPLQAAARRSIRFTLHDDTPVTPVNPLQLIWVAVNRLTTGGHTLGPEQRITALQALRAVTADAAWQNFEEDSKGTLEPGKLADFVILDASPLEVEPAKIRDIRILQTVVAGKTIYPADPAE